MVNRRRGAKDKLGKVTLAAIADLTTNTGWTSRTIANYLKTRYRVRAKDGGRLGTYVSRILKRGVKFGILVVDQGRYRMASVMINPCITNGNRVGQRSAVNFDPFDIYRSNGGPKRRRPNKRTARTRRQASDGSYRCTICGDKCSSTNRGSSDTMKKSVITRCVRSRRSI